MPTPRQKLFQDFSANSKMMKQLSMTMKKIESGWNIDHIQRSSQFKKSLQQTLNHFYPLAGTIKKDYFVDCNNNGVEFYKARILSFETRTNGTGLGSREVLLAIQYNIFDCGGLAIGVCVSYRMADGTSTRTFLKAWTIFLKFDAANFFPKKDMHWYNPNNFTTKEKVMRRLLFDKSSITALREKASPTADSQAISTLILGCLMATSKSRPAPAKFIPARDVVNLRVRMVPPMPIHSFRNLWYNASAVYSNGGMESFNVTSWCTFPFYDVDFGWGRPTWMCCPNISFKNAIIMMSTKDEQGIDEAYVSISEEDSIIFDSDLELLPFVSETIHD
ncbi:hypothetical protein I3843_15G130100 [Carya illinoinensis]|nr:hypothetical protein I3843_15G130100 [Carya illinoinensis]